MVRKSVVETAIKTERASADRVSGDRQSLPRPSDLPLTIPWCDFCGKKGHTQTRCWELHGRPASSPRPPATSNRRFTGGKGKDRPQANLTSTSSSSESGSLSAQEKALHQAEPLYSAAAKYTIRKEINMPVYTFEVASPVVRSVRDKEPSHFKFEIESYQALLNSIARTKSDKIETSEFNAGGQSWVLVIYPNGNTRDSGSGHISLYLKLANKPTGGSSVYATFKFFIFDKERETYITIQDARERRFDAGHLEWGIAKALPVAAFNDDKNALLVNDSCTFGAEVYVISSTATVARLSLAERLTYRSFTWAVYDYSRLRTDTYSDVFSIEERNWKLRLFPRGNLTGQGRFLSLYLYLDDRTDLTGGRKLYVECELSIRDQLTGSDFKQTVGFWFDSVNDHRGFDTFLSLADLNNPMKGYKQGDTLIIEAVINEIFVLKDIN
ncbi:hypothetical protein Droror1_Dr00005858 [Drosera rotundifolia]